MMILLPALTGVAACILGTQHANGHDGDSEDEARVERRSMVVQGARPPVAGCPVSGTAVHGG